ncbi:hypothetical protein D3C76_1166490 [compost metagenome]
MRVTRLVIDDRLAGRGAPGGGQAHLFFGHGVAIGATALGHHHHLAKQAVGDVAGGAFATEGRATAADGEHPFTLGVQGIGTAGAGRDQGIGVATGERRDVINAVDRLHAVDLEAGMPVRDLLVDFELIGVARVFDDAFFLFALFFFAALLMGAGIGLIGQQVLQVDGQAITGSDP